MYHLRKETYEMGEKVCDRAVFKHNRLSRFYRGTFTGLSGKYQGMRVYTCKTLKNILKLREATFNYCGEYFDVYDENGKIDIGEAV